MIFLLAILMQLGTEGGAEGVPREAISGDSVRADSVRADSVRADTVLAGTVQSDTIQSDTIQSDTLPMDSVYQDSIAGISRVDFKGDTVIYYRYTRDVVMLHNAEVKYGDVRVTSDSIRFSTTDRILTAYKGARLRAASDSVIGDEMSYAVETQKGVMYRGRTRIDKGFFYGQGIWLVEDDVLYINRGYYTTCERYPPHYDFYGLQLKVLVDDMVISRPIFLRLGRVPVLAAPFWYLPIGRDRKSGFMPFKFGNNESQGWFMKMVRYYWVPNDYTDATFSVDIMSRKGIQPGVEFNWLYGPQGSEYARGGFRGRYIPELDTRKRRWEFYLNNSSQFADGTRLTADLEFKSDARYTLDYLEDTDSLLVYLDQTTYSSASLSRKILGRSVSLSGDRSDNLTDSTWNMTLPRFSFSWPTLNPLDFFTVSFGSFSVSNQYRNDEYWSVDSLGDSSRVVSRVTGFSQPLSASWSYKFFGAYTFSQSWSAGQNLAWKTDSLGSDTLIRGGNYSLSNKLSTTFFRIFGIYDLGMNGVLHSVEPSVTHRITPRIATVQPWVVYPRFDTTLAAHEVTFNVTQTLQTKLRSRVDTSTFTKQELVVLGTGTSYDLLADSLRSIVTTVNLPTGLPVDASMSFTYDHYNDFNLSNDSVRLSASVGVNLDQIVFPLLGWEPRGRRTPEDTGGLADTLSQEEYPGFDTLDLSQADSLAADTTFDRTPTDTLAADSLLHPHPERESFVRRFSKSRLSIGDIWTLSGDWNGLETRSHMLTTYADLYFPFETQLRLNLGFNFSQPSGRFEDYITSYSMSLIKGLHCWEAVFEVRPSNALSWNLDSLEWNVYVRIKELPDIEIGKGLIEQFRGQ